MRLALISDVHGNLHALRAAIAALQRQGVDAWISAGDLIGYGPHPNECVETVAGLSCTAVAGNHELIVLGRLSDGRSSARAQASHRWTRGVLRDDVVEYLAALPVRAQVGPVVVAHGSLDDPEEYVRSIRQASAQLVRLRAENPAARFLVLGNTHRQLLFAEGTGRAAVRPGTPAAVDGPGAHVVNPGSVGQSRQWEWPPRARAAVLDTELETVVFERIPYDVGAVRRDLTAAGLPYGSVHAPRPLRSIVTGRARRLSQRVRGGAAGGRERGPETVG